MTDGIEPVYRVTGKHTVGNGTAGAIKSLRGDFGRKHDQNSARNTSLSVAALAETATKSFQLFPEDPNLPFQRLRSRIDIAVTVALSTAPLRVLAVAVAATTRFWVIPLAILAPPFGAFTITTFTSCLRVVAVAALTPTVLTASSFTALTLAPVSIPALPNSLALTLQGGQFKNIEMWPFDIGNLKGHLLARPDPSDERDMMFNGMPAPTVALHPTRPDPYRTAAKALRSRRLVPIPHAQYTGDSKTERIPVAYPDYHTADLPAEASQS